jgi:hypothetical protein
VNTRSVAAGAPLATPASAATETDFYATVIDTARICGWQVAHFRPALTKHGWRTAVSGDGKGFPDFVLVHPAGHIWFVELKTTKARLSPEQQQWAEVLEQAGAIYRVVRVPDGIARFVQDLADTRGGVPCPPTIRRPAPTSPPPSSGRNA